ncbi:MAG: hypothetical protein IIZ12_00470, partial [Eggerthellaceae bacterium]|nr:hypothetical protein [Eggerthellaceae bacterium]
KCGDTTKPSLRQARLQKRGEKMADWKNLDQLDAYQALAADTTRVDLRVALAGEQGAQRVNATPCPWRAGFRTAMAPNR